jgi:hypothetical protein
MEEWRYSSTHFYLDSKWGEWVASRPGRFISEIKGTHWIGGWVDPRAGLGAVEKRKILLFRESNPRSSSKNHFMILDCPKIRRSRHALVIWFGKMSLCLPVYEEFGSYLKMQRPNFAMQWLASLLLILFLPGSNVDHETG